MVRVALERMGHGSTLLGHTLLSSTWMRDPNLDLLTP